MDSTSILAVLSLLLGGGFVTALIAAYKARPERDAVMVSTAQNAAGILQGLNESLYEELKRVREEKARAEAQRDAYLKELNALKEEIYE